MAVISIKGYEVTIDDDTLMKIKGKISIAMHGRYAQIRDQGKTVYLHRFVMGCIDSSIHVDHVNGNGLDNRKSNLRLCTRSQNLANRSKEKGNKSGFKGVFRHSDNDAWIAQICYQRKRIHIGCYPTPELAHKAYTEKAIELFGEFARTE